MIFCLCRDDAIRAIKKLAILGSGFKVLPLQGRQLVQSVPSELNKDHTEVLQLAEVILEISLFCVIFIFKDFIVACLFCMKNVTLFFFHLKTFVLCIMLLLNSPTVKFYLLSKDFRAFSRFLPVVKALSCMQTRPIK